MKRNKFHAFLVCVISSLLLTLSICGCTNSASTVGIETSAVKTESSTAEAKISEYVGTYKCDAWVTAQNITENNGLLVLEVDGTGRYQPGEKWATFQITWEDAGEDVILVYVTKYAGTITCDEYKYVDGVLTYDNGIVTRIFEKQ